MVGESDQTARAYVEGGKGGRGGDEQPQIQKFQASQRHQSDMVLLSDLPNMVPEIIAGIQAHGLMSPSAKHGLSVCPTLGL